MAGKPLRLCIYCFREFDEKRYFDELRQTWGFDYTGTSAFPTMETAELARGCDGICTTVNVLDEALLETFRSLGVRYILTRTVGHDHIDLKAAKRLGFQVSHVSYPPDTVADYTVMLLLMALRRMKPILERGRIQDYSLPGKMGRDIGECTVGILGLGGIGRTVAKRLAPFGCRILAYGPHETLRKTQACEFVDLDTLYRESDAVTVHIPATAENFHFVDRDAFARMKPGAVLVNTARGTVVDTDALIEALQSGRLSGAALDVIEDERGLCYVNRMGECLNNPQLAILRSLPNVILTSHMAFYTERVVRTMAEQTIRCLFDMESGTENPLILKL